MIDNWLTQDYRINLPELFAHLGYERTRSEKTYYMYRKHRETCIVFWTDKGYQYYKVQRPEDKLSAANLILDYVSKMEGNSKETVWDKVDGCYQKVLKEEQLLLAENSEVQALMQVTKEFNHFHSYRSTLTLSNGLYADAKDSTPFKGRIFEDTNKQPLFPLYNLQNENCGYFIDSDKGVTAFGESSLKNSLWFSNIPETLKWLIVFNDPREALAFHKKFGLKNAVYLALGEINYETSKILFQIRDSAKVKNTILSFTGNKKVEGYLRDLNFISFMSEYNFRLTLMEKNLLLQFRRGEEKAFLNFFNRTKVFNQGLAKSFLQYNKVLNQTKINQQSILVSIKKETVNVRVPLEVNAIKYFVWSYHKNYLSKNIDILKPVHANWHTEWETEQNRNLERKEVQLEDYRIAL